MLDKKNNVVLVVEKATAKLDVVERQDGKPYILEGVFTQFGIKNNNNRIYEEAEFLPHLDYLQSKIKKGRLVGELDHPEKFEVSLDRASHIVESLTYDKDNRQIVGRIKLLSTPAGLTARSLMDDGVQLSISSRAAGVVRENNTVQIKKIFTYDLVNDPGFENAQLTRITESLGFDKQDDINIFEMNMTEDELDSIIDKNDMKPSKNTTYKNINLQEKKEKNMSDFVSVNEFKNYSNYLAEKITLIEETFSNSLLEKDQIIQDLQRKLDSQKEYLNYISEETNNFREYTQDQLLEVNSLIGYAEYVANESNASVEYVKYISDVVDNMIDYSNYQTNETNKLEEYSNYLAENLDNSINENNNVLTYNNYLAEMLDKNIQYSEHLKEELEHSIDYTEHVVENTNNLIKFSDYIGEKLNTSINYQQYMSESINLKNGDIDAGSFLGINENRNDTEILIDNSRNITNKVDMLLESIQNQKNNDNTKKEKEFPYFNLLSENKKREFLLLNENQKTKVVENVRKQKPMSENEFIKLWESALSPMDVNDYYQTLINEMPKEYQAVWESLDSNTKNKVLAQSNYTNIDINNAYSIHNFWQTRSLLNERKDFQMLNENLSDEIKNNTIYGNNYMQNVAIGLDIMNKKIR